jgi:hypothetical protein
LGVPKNASKFASPKNRKKCKKCRFGTPKIVPKSSPNVSKIVVPKNIPFFTDFRLRRRASRKCRHAFCIGFYNIKWMCDAFLRIAFDMRFGSGKPPKNLSKTMPERPKNRLRELCFFRRRFFWASAQFWSNLGVQNGTQNCTFGPPKLRGLPQSTAYSVRIAFFVFFALNLKFAMKKRKT